MSLAWSPLPRGSFTGIDWSARDATCGWDPYLVWADCDAFAGYGGSVPKWLPVAIELRPGASISQMAAAASRAWLRVPQVYMSEAAPAGLRFCTARVRPDFFRAVQAGGPLHALVKRLEMGLAARNAEDEAHAIPAPQAATEPEETSRVSGKVFGLIDDSLALANARFLRADGAPRTAWFWRQDGRGQGGRPAGLGYGHELRAAEIAAVMDRCRHGGLFDEGAVYAQLGLSTVGQVWPRGRVPFHTLDLSVSHGSHVADLACGPMTAAAQLANLPPGFDAPPSWAPANDDASRCPIVAVQLDDDTVKDTSGGSLNVHVLDGLMYILSRCAADAEVTVNISFGSLAGPHDGTALLEAALDQLVALCGPRLAITLPAGNSYQARGHANLSLAPQQEQALHWRVAPDDHTQSFLELWLAEGAQVELNVTPPGAAQPLPVRAVGESGLWLDAQGRPVCGLIYPSRTATGEHGTCALLALAPTFSFDPVATAPAGVWKIALRNIGSASTVVDGYIERDDVISGTRTGARQSHFEDDPALPWDQQYDMQAQVDDPARLTPIRRSGSFNDIAAGAATVSVGGQRATDKSWARYSPRNPDPDAARPERPGVVKMPDTAAWSDENPISQGLCAAGTRSGGVVRLRGTSDASPQVARQLLNGTFPRATTAPGASS